MNRTPVREVSVRIRVCGSEVIVRVDPLRPRSEIERVIRDAVTHELQLDLARCAHP